MQKAPVMKGSGLMPLTDDKSSNAEEVHVFGRNLEERVVNNDNSETPSISFNTVESNQPSEDDIDSIRKRKFDAITGEEDEETIFQGDFKLFVWDKSTSNWIEKGRDSQTVWAASGSNASQLKDLIEERRRMTTEEENELRKKAKSESEQQGQQPVTTTSSSTSTTVKKVTEPEKPSASSSENQSTQKDSTNKCTSSSEDSRTSQDLKGETIAKSPTKKGDAEDGVGNDKIKKDKESSSNSDEVSNEEPQKTAPSTVTSEEEKPEIKKEDSTEEEEVKKVSKITPNTKQTTNGEVKIADKGGDES